MIEDIQAQLSAELSDSSAPLARESLALQMLETSSPPDRLSWLAQVVPRLTGSGVIYGRRQDARDEPQAELENSYQQFANVWGAFAVEGALAGEPVLFVDDFVDSRWTVTVAAAALSRSEERLRLAPRPRECRQRLIASSFARSRSITGTTPFSSTISIARRSGCVASSGRPART